MIPLLLLLALRFVHSFLELPNFLLVLFDHTKGVPLTDHTVMSTMVTMVHLALSLAYCQQSASFKRSTVCSISSHCKCKKNETQIYLKIATLHIQTLLSFDDFRFCVCFQIAVTTLERTTAQRSRFNCNSGFLLLSFCGRRMMQMR